MERENSGKNFRVSRSSAPTKRKDFGKNLLVREKRNDYSLLILYPSWLEMKNAERMRNARIFQRR